MAKDYELVHRIGVVNVSKGPAGNQINAVRKLTDKEYEDYKAAVVELRAWVNSDAHSLIRHSLKSLKGTVERCAELFRTSQHVNPRLVKLAINADFLNLLGNAHLYLNHTETMLKRATYPGADMDLAKFKELTAYQYDNVFAYRFSYRLRNYAIHCGFPISGFSAHGEIIKGTDAQRHSFNISFDSQELLSKFDKWGPQVKQDLSSMSEQFDAIKIAEEYVESLNHIRQEMLGQYAPRLHRLAGQIQKTASYAHPLQGNVHIISMPPDDEIKPPINALDISIERLPMDLVELATKIKPNKTKDS